MTLASGARLGPYEILAPLGAGGMGEVYRARDPRLGREVAVKVLPEDVAGDSARLSLFEREARAVAALNHPNILTVYDVGSQNGMPYVVTELLEGETLRSLVSKRSPTVQQVLGYALQAARGLEAAHAKGIVHRDLKPENLFLTTDGRVKVLDFGLAKLMRLEGDLGSQLSTAVRSSDAGQVVGTILYMSPEQARGLRVDVRSDVFSFGVVLYELLAQKHPFRKDTVAGTLTAIVEDTPAKLEDLSRAVSPAAGGIVRRCLQKSREERYASGHDVAVALEAVLGAPSETATLQEVEERSPYPGLSSFTEKDKGVFFGRETEARALWERIRNRRLLAVIGPSGAGKTSFLRAGVLASRPDGWAAIVCTPGATPFRGLGQALGPELAGDAEALGKLAGFEDPDTALDLVSRWRQGHGETLLVVDQFEELYTLNSTKAQRRFAALLGRLVSEADVHVLLSLRDDFLIRCSEQPSLARIFEHLTPLPPLGGADLRRALEEPAKKQGYRFEEEALVDEMVHAVEGARAALPLLAFAVSRLWEKRDRDEKLLTRAVYEEVGGVAGALAQHAEQTLERIGSDRQAIVREIFRNLVTAQWTRAAAEREELLSVCPDREAAALVLDALIGARLLTSYEMPAEGEAEEAGGAEEAGESTRHRIEIVHESLLKAWPRLVRWQAQDEEGAVLRDQLKQAAHLWEEKGRSQDLLWTGTAYQEYELWRQRYAGALTAVEDHFTYAMVEHVGRARKRRRFAVAAVVVGLAAIVGVTSTLWRRSELSRQRAEASNLVALGRVEIDRYPSAALAYARRSLEVADTPAGRRLAVEALWRGPTARILPLGDQSSWTVEFSPDGRWLASRPFSEKVLLFPDDGGPPRIFGDLPAPTGPHRIGFTPDGSAFLATTSTDGWESGVVAFSVPEGRKLRALVPDLPGGDLKTWWGHWWVPTGVLFAIGHTSTRGTEVRLELEPYSGGPSRVLGSYNDSPPVIRLVVDGTSRLALARGNRVFVRPVSGDPVTPEREVATLEDKEELRRLAFSPRGDSIAVAESTGRLALWPLDMNASREPRVFRIEKPEPQFTPTFDADGSRLIWASSAEGTLSLWRLDGPPDAEPVVLRRGAVQNTKRGVFHPNGNWLAVANHFSLTLWAVGQPQPFVLRGHESKIWHIQFTPDSRWLVSCDPASVHTWPLDPRAGMGRMIGLEGAGCNGLSVAPDGGQILLGSSRGLHVVPLSGREARVLADRPPDGGIWGVAFDEAGRRVAAATGFSPGPPKKLRIWDLDSDAAPRELPLIPPGEAGNGYDFGVFQLAFTPQGDLLAAGVRGIRRFDPESGESEWIWRLDGSWNTSMALSRDGRRLLAAARFREDTGARDHPVMLFDLPGGERRSITTHGNRVMAVALDPSGTVIVTGDAQGVVRVGPADGGEPHLLLGHTGAMDLPGNRVTVSPDGRWIASATGDEIRVWPMPDVTKPPLHTLRLGEFLTKLHELTNVQVVNDEDAPTGYKIEIGPFPGWKDVPTW